MKKLLIIEINKYNYILKDKNNDEYNVNIEFYQLESSPGVGDIIYMKESLLKSINNNVVSFGPLDGKCGREIEDYEDEDLIVLELKKKRVYLKRFYG